MYERRQLTTIQFSERTKFTGPAAFLCVVWWMVAPVTPSTRYTLKNAEVKFISEFFLPNSILSDTNNHFKSKIMLHTFLSCCGLIAMCYHGKQVRVEVLVLHAAI